MAKNRYEKILEEVFLNAYTEGAGRVCFSREDIEKAAKRRKIALPKNIGDLIYSFRFRTSFPASIQERAPQGKEWIIRLAGRAKYCFVATTTTFLAPRSDMLVTKVPDSTPGIIEKYALSDEQALLAKVRYNRLVDVFTGVACYSLQSHLRTAVPDLGQVETDEVYVGIDRQGAHYVFPVQAKGGSDKQSIVQVEQDIQVCLSKFPGLIVRPIAAQFMPQGVIAMLEVAQNGDELGVTMEKHYQLVPPDQVSPADLARYSRPS